MLKLRALCRTGAVARQFLAAERCAVVQKANSGGDDLDFGRLALRVENVVTKLTPAMPEMIQTWKEVHDIFYGPDRDFKNFPHPKMNAAPGSCRMYGVPEEYFQALYNKSGNLGPYILLFGFPTYCMSKEIWKFDNTTTIAATWALIFFYVLPNKINKDQKINKFLDKLAKEYSDEWHKPLVELESRTAEVVKSAELDMWRQAGLDYMHDAKKENLALQMESVFRERLQNVYKSAKRLLDYQVELIRAKQNCEQQHMVNWITDSVYSSVTPTLEKQALADCFANLKELSKTNSATIQ